MYMYICAPSAFVRVRISLETVRFPRDHIVFVPIHAPPPPPPRRMRFFFLFFLIFFFYIFIQNIQRPSIRTDRFETDRPLRTDRRPIAARISVSWLRPDTHWLPKQLINVYSIINYKTLNIRYNFIFHSSFWQSIK